MSIPGLPAGIHRKALDALLGELGRIPGAPFRTVASWSGRPADAMPTTTAMMPWCRLSLLRGPVVTRRAGPLVALEERARLLVQVATAGTDQGDLADAWDAIARALFPATPDSRRALDARLLRAGIRDLKLLQPALPAGPGDFRPGSSMQGAGVVEILLCY